MKLALIGASKLPNENKIIKEDEYFSFGRWCANEGIELLTGACGGIPYIIGRGCLSHGGSVTGYSPATSLVDHTGVYNHPVDGCSRIIYLEHEELSVTSCFIARSIPMIEVADLVVSFNGSWGTMCELIIALFNGKKIVVCEDSGGASKLFHDNHLFLSCEPTFQYNEMVISAKTISEVKKVLIG